jgi:Cd2+/Zn2+-exporting ATPase
LLPAEKAALVSRLRDQTGAVAMVGDGVNDGPALGSATVGFAMALTGSDLAVETADVAILRNDLFAVPGAIALSRKTVGIIRQNIGISLAVKLIALILTLLGITTLWMAVAVDLGTSLLVTANALRLTRWQLPGSGPQHAEVSQPATALATGVASGDA